MPNFKQLFSVLLILSNAPLAAFANDWPGTEKRCDDCVAVPTPETGVKAFRDVRDQGLSTGGNGTGGLSDETMIAIGTGVTTAAGIAYGTGKYLDYKKGIAAAAREATMLRIETRRVAHVVVEALKPELERFGRALVELEKKRGAALTTAEVESALAKGLASTETRKRIMLSLKGSLGSAAEATFEKLVSPTNSKLMSGPLLSLLRRLRGAVEVGVEKDLAALGKNMAHDLAKAVAPTTARQTLRYAAFAAAKAAQKGLFSRCVAGLGRLAGGALRVVGSSAFLVVTIVLEPSEVGAATMDAAYAAHPEMLFNLPPEQAEYWISHYSNVRMSVTKLHDVLKEGGALDAVASNMPEAELNASIEACLTEAPVQSLDQDGMTCH